MTEQNLHPEHDQKTTDMVEDTADAERAEVISEEEEKAPLTYEQLQAKVEELEGMLKDEQLRSLANEQNLRRRSAEEVQAAYKFASQRFATEMLSVKDYLEMALQDQSGNFEALKMGVQMTLTELEKAFEHTHLTEINPKSGDKLDPQHHQAIQAVDSDQEPNSIVKVMKKGYMLHDRVLRPAMVVVAKSNDDQQQ